MKIKFKNCFFVVCFALSKALDISKAFDKVRHKGFIFKLKQNCISSDLLNVLSDLLNDRKQTVVLKGQISSWAKTDVEFNERPNLIHPCL